eukprot:ANDGO_03303.mRNA.1 hypothetical protein PHYSODRAFT_337810
MIAVGQWKEVRLADEGDWGAQWKERKMLIAQVGVRGFEADKVLQEANQCMVFGMCPSVSLGGIILAGGYTYMFRHHGSLADMVVLFRCILANGTMINASASENSDLYASLRGGGSIGRFMLVHEMVLLLPPNPVDNVTVISLSARWTDPKQGKAFLHIFSSICPYFHKNVTLTAHLQTGREDPLLRLKGTSFLSLNETRTTLAPLLDHLYHLPAGVVEDTIELRSPLEISAILSECGSLESCIEAGHMFPGDG